MYTSIVLVALAGSTLSAVPESLQFKSDYVAARKQGSRDHKPLAVFVGSGPKGWEQRTTEGQLSQDVQSLLQSHYVCVYLDTTSDEGRRIAKDFGMKEGVVLSDALGENQAFRHTGNLSNGDLVGQLKKFSEPDRVATRTESLTREDVRFYPAEPTYAPQGYAPQGYAPQGYAPQYGPSSFVVPSSSNCSSCSRR